jgi:hypothetical protein
MSKLLELEAKVDAHLQAAARRPVAEAVDRGLLMLYRELVSIAGDLVDELKASEEAGAAYRQTQEALAGRIVEAFAFAGRQVEELEAVRAGYRRLAAYIERFAWCPHCESVEWCGAGCMLHPAEREALAAARIALWGVA